MGVGGAWVRSSDVFHTDLPLSVDTVWMIAPVW